MLYAKIMLGFHADASKRWKVIARVKMVAGACVAPSDEIRTSSHESNLHPQACDVHPPRKPASSRNVDQAVPVFLGNALWRNWPEQQTEVRCESSSRGCLKIGMQVHQANQQMLKNAGNPRICWVFGISPSKAFLDMGLGQYCQFFR